jgi:hypothetical protein
MRRLFLALGTVAGVSCQPDFSFAQIVMNPVILEDRPAPQRSENAGTPSGRLTEPVPNYVSPMEYPRFGNAAPAASYIPPAQYSDQEEMRERLLREIIDKYNQTAKGIIDSLGR